MQTKSKTSEAPSRKVYHALNAHERPKNYKQFTKPSLAVPDQSLTIDQLIKRYRRGQPLEGVNTPIYEEEDENLSTRVDGVNPKTLDLVDIQERIMEADEVLAKRKNDVDLFEANRKRQEKQEEREAIRKEEAEKLRQENSTNPT